jgi:hypothetical protein
LTQTGLLMEAANVRERLDRLFRDRFFALVREAI